MLECVKASVTQNFVADANPGGAPFITCMSLRVSAQKGY
jgi:hypothetical protein